MINKRHGFVFQFLILISILAVSCKQETTVSFLNRSNQEELVVYYMAPDGDFYQYVHKDTVRFKGKYELSIPVKGAGIVNFICPSTNMSLGMPMEQGKNYSLAITDDSFFPEGSEITGQLLYIDFYKDVDHYSNFARSYANSDTAEKLENAIDADRQEMQDKLDEALKNKSISHKLYALLASDLDCFWRTIVGDVAMRNSGTGITENSQTMWDMAVKGANFESMTSSHSFPDFQEVMANYRLAENIEETMKLASEGMINTAYWNKYKLNLSGPVLEHTLAAALYYNMIQKNYELELITLFDDFKTLFPSSTFLSDLEPMAYEIEEYNRPVKNYDDVIFINNNEECKTLADLLSFLRGKKLYVDVWATWCGPCKSEFEFLSELEPVLKDKGYEALYISIDQEDRKETWMEMIDYYKLKGYHYMFSKIPEDLLAIIGFDGTATIPHEFIVSETGEIVNANAHRPSQMELLIPEL